MFTTVKRELAHAIRCGFVLIAIALCTRLIAEESKQATTSTDNPCKGCKACQVRVEVHGKIPFIDKLPIVKQLFKNAEVHDTAKDDKEMFERIGVDFDLVPGQMVRFVPFGDCEAACTEYGCTFCPNTEIAASTKVACNHECCKAATTVACNHECCKAAGCKTCSESKEVAAKLELPVGNECRQVCNESRVAEHCGDCDRMTELRVQYHAMQSTMEAHEAFAEAFAEAKDSMFERLLELSSEKAKLEAQVEILSQQGGLQEKLLEALAENAKLKATVELAEERHALLKQSFEVTAENERLKSRIAELEHHGQSAKATKTAKKPQSKKGTVVE